ncbi:MAG: hypothetical protein IJB64_04665 [Akkermansia sp.]|nr:hypothetical protein [Akkermansia sp.]
MTMMPIIRKILATTALCLAAVGLSSCMRTGESMLSHANWYQAIVTTEYEQHNDNKGKDDASMEFKVPVYQVGNKYYVQGEKAVLHYRIGKLLVFPDELLNDRYVYAAPNGDKAYYEVEFQESTNEKLWLFAEDLSTPLRDLPKENQKAIGCYAMRAYRSLPGSVECGGYFKDKGYAVARIQTKPRLSWRALYAYPAAAALFICVDVPASCIITPCYLLYEFVQ